MDHGSQLRGQGQHVRVKDQWWWSGDRVQCHWSEVRVTGQRSRVTGWRSKVTDQGSLVRGQGSLVRVTAQSQGSLDPDP